MRKLFGVFSLAVVALLCLACNPSKRLNKEFLYFQNGRDSLGAVQLNDRVIQPNDLLSILFFSKTLNQEQAAVFNIPAQQGYQVGSDGYIEIPIVGEVKVTGCTRNELQHLLCEKLSPYIKNPSALVRFRQFRVNVLGEVHGPGVKSFETDRVTLLDALGAAGDLTEQGSRKNVVVIREEAGGHRHMYQVDLKSVDLFQSSAYQLRANDIVYVCANDQKLKALNNKRDPLKVIQIGASLLSVLSTIIFLIKS
ncbi:polysaccharide biosynthesis/export family protein [Paraflavisolibacter sp. H34]|uniref:polysaccharide biosynthesis/export family protein n=1 Tax=Huijunlia imazamoxiresistens TaxID=3127457 RepID=UPI003015E5C2